MTDKVVISKTSLLKKRDNKINQNKISTEDQKSNALSDNFVQKNSYFMALMSFIEFEISQ